MHQQQQPQPRDSWLAQNGPGLIYRLLESWAFSVTVFLRTGFGQGYLNTRSGFVVLVVPLFAFFFHGFNLAPLYWFLAAYAVMVWVARIRAWRIKRRGVHIHSLYNGWPRLMPIFSRLGERNVKNYVEPLIVLVAAAIAAPFCWPLFAYLMYAALWLAVTEREIDREEERRAQQMHDSVLDQELIVERFRTMRRG